MIDQTSPSESGSESDSGSADAAKPASDQTAGADDKDSRPHAGASNRLAKESSPYLLLHAHNPVDWYPWGPEAFEKARSEGKPIFLSVGYSSCYWCHVMERETFSNPKVAAFLNSNFVSIKVDREERPDVDDIYMTCLIVYQQASGAGGGGGWPLSMFLTPEGNPIAGATYLPPEDTPDGRTGFLTAASRVHTLWEKNPDSLRQSASMIAGEVRRLSSPGIVVESAELKRELVEAAVTDVQGYYDPVHGGVDFRATRPNGPRFPNVPRLRLLLTVHLAEQRPELLKIVEHSLTAMAEGGIRDHLAGGFHRYSTDRHWHVPHFEKMLYDQAQLLEIYSTAAAATQNPLYAEVAAELADFVQRELTLPDGGFCSALDAETNAVEGEYYVWSPEEVRNVLGSEDAEFFMTIYGMQQPNTFEHGFVLHLPESLAAAAGRLGVSRDNLAGRLTPLRDKLLAARSMRQRPLLDDKVLTEWNAMMIRALATSGQLPGREQDLQAAARAAQFVLTSLRGDDGQLMRSWRNGTAVYRAYLDDYAFLASALLKLHEATGEDRWLTAAHEITKQQIELFYDAQQSVFFFTSRDHEQLIARTSSAYDSTSPSGNSVTVRNLLQIQRLMPKAVATSGDRQESLNQIAKSILTRFSSTLKSSPAACSGMAMALHDWLQAAAEKESPETHAAENNRPDEFPLRSDVQILTSATPQQTEKPAAGTAAAETSVPDVDTQTVFRPVIPATPAPASPLQKDAKKDRPVRVKVYPLFDKLERGSTCPIAIELTIDKAWHINANPSQPDFLVPTELKISSMQKVRMTRVKYPKHELLNVTGSDEPYHVYSGRILIYGLLETEAAEAAEAAELEIQIRYQACNESTCMTPDAIVLKGKLPLASPGDPIRRIHEDKFPKPKEDSKSSDDEVK